MAIISRGLSPISLSATAKSLTVVVSGITPVFAISSFAVVFVICSTTVCPALLKAAVGWEMTGFLFV